MAATTDKKPSEVARDLGVAPSTLNKWIKLYGQPASSSDGANSHAELLQEVKRLKKELAFVTEQREILKKAAAILGN